jgi:hypothetical protein
MEDSCGTFGECASGGRRRRFGADDYPGVTEADLALPPRDFTVFLILSSEGPYSTRVATGVASREAANRRYLAGIKLVIQEGTSACLSNKHHVDHDARPIVEGQSLESAFGAPNDAQKQREG